jgi:DamX protein
MPPVQQSVAPVAPAASTSPLPPAAQQVISAPAAASATAVAAPAASTAPAPVAPSAAGKAPVAASTPLAATATAGTEMPVSVRPGSKNFVPPAPPSGKLTRERFAATQEWLKSAPADQYSIQLLTAGIHDLRRIEELLARATARNLKLSDFYVYGVKINDQQHYRLAYGLYPTLADSNQGIKDLPAVYRQFAPFQRSVERMRSQNRQ